MLTQLHNRQAGYSLAQPFYNDPAFHALDMEYIWARCWLFIGHTCEVAKPGDYFTVQIGDDSIIIVRDRNRTVHAFFNSCRHRGSKICNADKGNAAKLVCPYHQWTYELDGRLLFARDMGSDFVPSRWDLKPVHCETVAGYIFICLADKAPDFAAFRANAEPYLAPHALEDAKVAYTSSIVENGNWKLVMENNRECYHCMGGHPELLRVFPDTPNFNPADDPVYGKSVTSLWSRMDARAIPSRFSMHGHYRMIRMPLINKAVSMTMSGAPAVKRRLGQLQEADMGSLLMFYFPNTWNHLLADHAVTFRVLPLGPQQTLVTTKWLVHKDAVEGVDYQIDELSKIWEATNAQDRRQVEENQLGVNSRAYEPGPYSPVHESGEIHFVDWYAEQIQKGMSPSESAAAVAAA
jgi:Rieske 2Fe-2S family protein